MILPFYEIFAIRHSLVDICTDMIFFHNKSIFKYVPTCDQSPVDNHNNQSKTRQTISAQNKRG